MLIFFQEKMSTFLDAFISFVDLISSGEIYGMQFGSLIMESDFEIDSPTSDRYLKGTQGLLNIDG